MYILVNLMFVFLLSICIIIQLFANKTQSSRIVGNNPTFLKFQRIYLASYLLAQFGDWLQGPYLYKLYSHYRFQEDQIAVLYVCGYASTIILGTWAPIAADRFGRKKLCLFFTVIYSLACFLKLSSNYSILIGSRLLSGLATSLLFSTFEAWYITEHIENFDFPEEWINVTFIKATVYNGFLAISAGIIGNVFAEWMMLGPIAPFMLAIPCFTLAGIVVVSQWPENYSKQKSKLTKSCMEGLQNIVDNSDIFLIGIIQSLFESVMYIFIFLWTPVLDRANPSLGIVFSSFMVCIQIGAAIFQISQSYFKITMSALLIFSMVGATASSIMLSIAAHPPHMFHLSFFAFLVFEISVGIYFPAMGKIQSNILPPSHRRSILNWFRIPLNLIACIILMLLHNSWYGNRLIFCICSALLAFAILGCVKLYLKISESEQVKVNNSNLIISNSA